MSIKTKACGLEHTPNTQAFFFSWYPQFISCFLKTTALLDSIYPDKCRACLMQKERGGSEGYKCSEIGLRVEKNKASITSPPSTLFIYLFIIRSMLKNLSCDLTHRLHLCTFTLSDLLGRTEVQSNFSQTDHGWNLSAFPCKRQSEPFIWHTQVHNSL